MEKLNRKKLASPVRNLEHLGLAVQEHILTDPVFVMKLDALIEMLFP